MSPGWEDLNARARGLGTHLLSESQLERLESAADADALAADLRTAGVDVQEGAGGARDLEHAVRRDAAATLRVLLRWCGPRSAVLAVLLEDEDRRSLRALLRGAAQRAPAEERLAGLLATPSLPESALAELAAQPTIRAVVTLLVAWRNPYGPPLRAEANSAAPDLLVLELALARAFAARALRQARRAGRRGPIVAHARLMIDLDNAQTAISFAGGAAGLKVADFFLPAGEKVSKARFLAAIHAGTVARAADILAAAFPGTALQAALKDGALDPSRLESALLAAQVRMLEAKRRVDPLGPVTVLHFMLRLRLQLVELRRIIWTVALGGGAHVAAAGAAS